MATRGPQGERLTLSILDSGKRNDVAAGTHCDSVRTVQRWQDLGFGMTTLASGAVLPRRTATPGYVG